MIKHLSWYSSLAVMLLMLAACAKNDPAPATPSTVQFNVINASPDPNEVFNFYLNGTRQNSVTGISSLAATGYLPIPTGQQTLSLKRLFDTDNFNNADTLFTLPIDLQEVSGTEKYSLFAAGTTRSNAFITRDTLKTDTANAMVRFVSASSAVPAFTVYFNDTLRFKLNTFKTASKYTKVGNGAKVIKVFGPASSTVPLLNVKVTMNADSVYTLFSAGTANNFRVGLLRSQ